MIGRRAAVGFGAEALCGLVLALGRVSRLVPLVIRAGLVTVPRHRSWRSLLHRMSSETLVAVRIERGGETRTGRTMGWPRPSLNGEDSGRPSTTTPCSGCHVLMQALAMGTRYQGARYSRMDVRSHAKVCVRDQAVAPQVACTVMKAGRCCRMRDAWTSGGRPWWLGCR